MYLYMFYLAAGKHTCPAAAQAIVCCFVLAVHAAYMLLFLIF